MFLCILRCFLLLTYYRTCLCCISQTQKELLDQRSLNLAGEPRWIRSGIQIGTKTSALTAHDWLRVMQGAGDYILAGVCEPGSVREEALYALLSACQGLLETESSADHPNDDALQALQMEVLEALCLCEAALPLVTQPICLHILMHVADGISRWGSVRNFWCFFGERYTH